MHYVKAKAPHLVRSTKYGSDTNVTMFNFKEGLQTAMPSSVRNDCLPNSSILDTETPNFHKGQYVLVKFLQIANS